MPPNLDAEMYERFMTMMWQDVDRRTGNPYMYAPMLLVWG